MEAQRGGRKEGCDFTELTPGETQYGMVNLPFLSASMETRKDGRKKA